MATIDSLEKGFEIIETEMEKRTDAIFNELKEAISSAVARSESKEEVVRSIMDAIANVREDYERNKAASLDKEVRNEEKEFKDEEREIKGMESKIYEKGYREAYQQQHDAVYNEGYNVGYAKGYSEGYSKGSSESYTKGYNEGYNKGYSDGYNKV